MSRQLWPLGLERGRKGAGFTILVLPLYLLLPDYCLFDHIAPSYS